LVPFVIAGTGTAADIDVDSSIATKRFGDGLRVVNMLKAEFGLGIRIPEDGFIAGLMTAKTASNNQLII
jgi:hypothetical protein